MRVLQGVEARVAVAPSPAEYFANGVATRITHTMPFNLGRMLAQGRSRPSRPASRLEDSEQSVNNSFPNTREQRISPGAYTYEEPTRQTTCINLLTGGLLVRVQPEEPFPSTTYDSLVADRKRATSSVPEQIFNIALGWICSRMVVLITSPSLRKISHLRRTSTLRARAPCPFLPRRCMGTPNLRDERRLRTTGTPGLRVSRPSRSSFPITMAGTAASA